MNKTVTYTQCRLRRGAVEFVAWIPSVFAVRNRYLKLKKDGEWENGWVVVSCGGEQPAEYIGEHQRDYLTQREASDI